MKKNTRGKSTNRVNTKAINTNDEVHDASEVSDDLYETDSNQEIDHSNITRSNIVRYVHLPF